MVSNIDNAQACGHVQSGIIYEGIGEVSILLFFFGEETLHAKKSIKC